MVQFGLYLRSFLYQPWEKHYLDYENLKNALYEIKHELFAAAAVQQESKEELDPKQAYVQFKEELDRNLNKINQFYEETREMCRVELKAVEDVAVYRKRWADADAEKYRKALERTYVQLVILKDFASINYTGFAKLMKKHDKLIKRYVEPLRAMYLKDKVNKKPVFGILDDVYKLQVEAQYLYADLFHDGNRIEAEIALGAALLEDIGETKRSRIAPRAILFSSIDVNQAEERVINESNETHARKKSTEFSMTWMRARLAIMSAGSNDYVMSLLIALILIFVGGCGQTLILEYMVHKDPDCGQTITFFQFLFIAVGGASDFVTFDRKNKYWLSLQPRKISFFYHALLVILSWAAAYTSAKAYYFKISVSLHMVFKSGILVINMILGYLFVKKRYTKLQMFSIVIVTLGVLVTTLASLPQNNLSSENNVDIVLWTTGLFVLSFSLIMTGLLGVLQDYTYEKFGKQQWQEVLFYVHLLGLPLYIVSADKIWSDMTEWTYESPIMWLALFGNSFLSFVGVRGIYNLTGLTTSLTTSLMITVRKFASLIISAVFFSDEAFSTTQWGGALLVMLGSVLYSTSSPVSSNPVASASHSPVKIKRRSNSTILRKPSVSFDDKPKSE